MSGLFADQIFWVLVLTTLVLSGMAAFFALFTFLLRLKNEHEARIWAGLEQRWGPPNLGVLMEEAHPSSLHPLVKKGEEIHFLEFVFEYAQRLKSAERDLLSEATRPYLPLILPRLKHRRIGIRARAVQTLGTLGLPEYAEAVRDAIQDPAPYVAAIAARHLAHEVGPKAADDVCRGLARFTNFRIWYLVDMVVAMGPPAIPAIRKTLADPDMPVQSRAVVAHALSVLRDLGSADLAANIAIGERDPTFLAALLRLLGQVGTPKHAISAREHLESPEFFVRAAATRTLAELGTAEDLPMLVERLNDPSSWVKMAAAKGVYRLGGKAALTALIDPDDPASPWFRQVLAEETGR